jgi:beta-galactosidase beta subunit
MLNLIGFQRANELDGAHSFPLAMSHTVHEDVSVLEAMLALTFRPSDAHCIHVDKKAKEHIKKAVISLVRYKHTLTIVISSHAT